MFEDFVVGLEVGLRRFASEDGEPKEYLKGTPSLLHFEY
jgi:hypothetical protein